MHQQHKKDQLVFFGVVLAITLLPWWWCECEHRYKTSIALAEGGYLCLCPLIFCCISGFPLVINQSSPTPQFLSCRYHQVWLSWDQSPKLATFTTSLNSSFPNTVLWDCLVAQSKRRMWTLQRTRPSFLHCLMLIHTEVGLCKSFLCLPRQTPTRFKEGKQ